MHMFFTIFGGLVKAGVPIDSTSTTRPRTKYPSRSDSPEGRRNLLSASSTVVGLNDDVAAAPASVSQHVNSPPSSLSNDALSVASGAMMMSGVESSGFFSRGANRHTGDHLNPGDPLNPESNLHLEADRSISTSGVSFVPPSSTYHGHRDGDGFSGTTPRMPVNPIASQPLLKGQSNGQESMQAAVRQQHSAPKCQHANGYFRIRPHHLQHVWVPGPYMGAKQLFGVDLVQRGFIPGEPGKDIRLMDVPGDGNCFWRALAEALKAEDPVRQRIFDNAKNSWLPGSFRDDSSFKVLKEEVFNFHKSSIPANLTDENAKVLWNEFLATEKNDVWAESTTIMAAATALNKRICVRSNVNMIQCFPEIQSQDSTTNFSNDMGTLLILNDRNVHFMAYVGKDVHKLVDALWKEKMEFLNSKNKLELRERVQRGSLRLSEDILAQKTAREEEIKTAEKMNAERDAEWEKICKDRHESRSNPWYDAGDFYGGLWHRRHAEVHPGRPILNDNHGAAPDVGHPNRGDGVGNPSKDDAGLSNFESTGISQIPNGHPGIGVDGHPQVDERPQDGRRGSKHKRRHGVRTLQDIGSCLFGCAQKIRRLSTFLEW